MSFVHVQITNPTQRNRAYVWFPGGLTLPPGASKTVDFDPLSRIDEARGYAHLMKKDVLEGVVKLQYKIDPPCIVVGSFSSPEKHAPRATAKPDLEVHHDVSNDVVEKIEEIDDGTLTVNTPLAEMAAPTVMPPVAEEKPVDLSLFAEAVTVAGEQKAVVEDIPEDIPEETATPQSESPSIPDTVVEDEPIKRRRGKRKAKNSF